MEINKQRLVAIKIAFIILTLFGLADSFLSGQPWTYTPYGLGFALIYFAFALIIISSLTRDLPEIKIVKLLLLSVPLSGILTYIIYQFRAEPIFTGLWYTYNNGLPFTIYHYFISDTFDKAEYFDYYGILMNLAFYTVSLFYLFSRLKFSNKLIKPINENSN